MLEKDFKENNLELYVVGEVIEKNEKEAAAKQTFTFLAPLTNEQPCEAGRDSA